MATTVRVHTEVVVVKESDGRVSSALCESHHTAVDEAVVTSVGAMVRGEESVVHAACRNFFCLECPGSLLAVPASVAVRPPVPWRGADIRLELVPSSGKVTTVAFNHARTMIVVCAPNVRIGTNTARGAVSPIDLELPAASVAAGPRRVHPQVISILQSDGTVACRLGEPECAPVDETDVAAISRAVPSDMSELRAFWLVWNLDSLHGP
mmetsp:Transcript_7419/g.16997  ORF Transcript_7419/g.16997 Transcript_7419/m.16997 type:complete len:209 (+) Transcript_7419:326-952(+)